MHADHLYQPNILGSSEAWFQKGSKGYSSYGAAAASTLDEMTFSNMPNILKDSDMLDAPIGSVAQLYLIGRNLR